MEKILKLMIDDVDNSNISFYKASDILWKNLSNHFYYNIKNNGIQNIQSQNEYNSFFSYILEIGDLSKEIAIWSYYNYLKSKDKFNIFDKIKILPSNNYDFNISNIIGRKNSGKDIILNWDYLITIDTIQTLIEKNEKILTDNIKICEIGAGWGRIGYYLTQINNKISYNIFDIPPILYISHEYLLQNVKHTQVFNYEDSKINLLNNTISNGISFYTPHMLEKFNEKEFDLTINIASFQEMSLNQVEEYFKVIDKKSKSFYSQQRYSDLEMSYDKYPVYDNWEKILDKDVSFHPLWFEKYFNIK